MYAHFGRKINEGGEPKMASTNINIRTNSELKAKAQEILNDLGLDMSTAVNIFLKQIVYKQAIPFEIAKAVGKKTKLGGWEGKIKMSEDFNEPMEEFQEYYLPSENNLSSKGLEK